MTLATHTPEWIKKMPVGRSVTRLRMTLAHHFFDLLAFTLFGVNQNQVFTVIYGLAKTTQFQVLSIDSVKPPTQAPKPVATATMKT